MSKAPLIALLVGITAWSSVGAADNLFEDYFVHELKSWDAMSCCWSAVGYDNGKLLRQRSESGHLYNSRIVVSGRTFADSIIETKVRFAGYPAASKGGEVTARMGAGILFGFQDDDNFFLFRLAGEDHAVLGKVVDGSWIELGNKAVRKPVNPRVENLEAAPWYVLRVELDPPSGKINCYLDGNAVFALEDKRLTASRVGLTTFKSMADFAYFKVSKH